MAIRPSRQALEELNNARANKKQQLAQAYAELGGRNTALTPNYAKSNPTPTASIPTLEKAVVSQYEEAENSGGIQNIAKNMKPDSLLNLANLMETVRGQYGDAVQTNANIYNELKNAHTRKVVENNPSPEITTTPTIMGMGNGVYGLPTTAQTNAGVTREDLQRLYDEENRGKAERRARSIAESHPVLGSAMASISRPIESAEGVLQNLAEYATGKPLSQTYTPSNVMREQVNEGIESGIGRGAYGVVNSMSDMTLAMLLAGGNPKLASTLMGVEKASDVMNDANARGLSPEQIIAEGGLSGVSTGITERFPMGRLGTSANIFASAASEGAQEGLEDIADNFFDDLVTKYGGNSEKSTRNIIYNAYIEAGYTPEEAKKATESEMWKQVGLDALLGAITGGTMQMGGNFIRGNNAITGKPRNGQNETQAKEEIPVVEKTEEEIEEAEPIPTVNQTEAREEVQQNIPSLNSVLSRAASEVNTFLTGYESNVLGKEELADLRQRLLDLGNQNPEAQNEIRNLWRSVERVVNAQPQAQTQTAQPEVSGRDLIQQSRDTRNLINRAEQYKAKLSSFGNKTFNKRLDNAINAVREGKANAVENLNTLLAQIDEKMNGETIGVSERAINQDMYDQMKNATDGRVIHISPETLKAMDMSVTELNELISTGTGRLRFKLDGGAPIDEAYNEIYGLANGMLPEPRSMGESDMVDAIVEYMTDAKSGKDSIVNETSWNDTPLEETRSSAVVEAQNLSDALIDDAINGQLTADKFNDYVREMSDLGRKYPDAADDIWNVLEQTDREYRNLKMDADVREAKTPEDINKSLLKYNLQFLSDYDEDADTNTDSYGRVETGREKVSQTYSNTESKNMTEEERTLHEQDRKFLYNENTEKESMEEASRRLLENGFLKERKRLMSQVAGYNNVDVDEMMKLHKHYSDLGLALEAQGKDATKEFQTAADIFNRLREKITDDATALQALAKWSRNTPEGLLAQAGTIIQKYENGLKRAGKTFNLSTEVQKATKNAKQMDANFMRDFMKEAKNLFTGSWEDVKNVTDGYTIHITPEMVKALGYSKLNELNSDVFTNTSNSIRFTTKAKEGSSLRDSYKQMQEKAPDLLASPTGMTEEQMLRTLVSFIQSKGQIVNFDSQSARHTMAKLGAMVNEQMPPTIRERVTTLLMDNMLGNIRTLITRNAGGNVGFNLIEDFVRSPLTGVIDSIVAKKTGTRAVSGLTREGFDAGKEGFIEGLKQGIYDFKNNIQSARTGENTLQNAVSNNRNNTFDLYNKKGEKIHKSKILQTYNKLVKAGLDAGDRPFYEKTYKRSIAEYNKLYEQGLIRDKLTGKVIDRNKFDEIADMYAKYNALQAVYQDSSSMAEAFIALKEGIGKVSEGLIGSDILSQFSMPFVKTPANIIARSIEYSPLGFAKNLVTTLKEYYSRSEDFNQARFSTELSRNIIGTALFALGMYAANAGALTGGYSEDKDMKQAQKEAGMQEYALHTGIGDFDLSWIPVLGNNAVSAAAAYDKYRNSQEGGLTALSDGLTAGVSSQLDTSALQGLQRLVGGSGKSGYDSNATLIDNARNTLLSGLSQLVPSLARQTAAFLDENQRQLSGPGENDYYRNNILNGIPFLRETLQPKIGRTGEELEQNPGQGTLGKFLSNFISPATWTRGTEDAVRDEAMRLFEATGNNIAFQPSVTMGELRTDDHNPTAEEFTEYQREAYTNMNQIAQQMIGSDFYASLSDGDKELVLDAIYKAVKNVAKVHALGTDTSSLSGAAKAYNNGGAEALLEYVTAGRVLSDMGMQNNDKNRETILQTLEESGVDALTQMVQQSQELANAGLDQNMQFKYDHATNYIPSLTPTQFAEVWTAVNTDKNSSIKQDEIIAWLNQNPTAYNSDTALMYWRALDGNSGTEREWASIPVLNQSTGLWEAKKS